jgi:hypothetical protein
VRLPILLPTFAPVLGLFHARFRVATHLLPHLHSFCRYFVLTAVWLLVAAAALVCIHRLSRTDSEVPLTLGLTEDLISKNPALHIDSAEKEPKHPVISFTTRSFDQMHQYSVIFIVLSSGFWQYFVQGLMGQLALGPLSYSEYQNDLFWIQQCHLTIGAGYPFTLQPVFLNANTGSLLGRSMCYAHLVVACLQRRWVSYGACTLYNLNFETSFQVVWCIVGLQSICSVFLCVIAASNVSSKSWHPLPLVLSVVMIGSTAHGVLTTCKLFAPHLYRVVYATVSSFVNFLFVFSFVIYRFFFLLSFFFFHYSSRGIFVCRELDVSIFKIAPVEPLSCTMHIFHKCQYVFLF